MESLKKLKKQEQRKKDKQRKKDVEKRKKGNERRLKERNKVAASNAVNEANLSQTAQTEKEEKKKKGFIFWLGRNKVRVGAGLAGIAGIALGLSLYCGSGSIDNSISDKEPQPNKPGIEQQDPDFKPGTPTPTPGTVTTPPVQESAPGTEPTESPEVTETPSPQGPGENKPSTTPGVVNPGSGETDTEVPPVVETPPVKEEHTVHNFGEWVDNGEDEVRECLECGEQEHRAHNYGNPVVKFIKNIFKKGTHVVNSTATCEHCGHQVQTSWAEDCSYGEVTYDDTYDYRTCEHCGDTLKQRHVLDNGRIENGVEIFSCTNDGCGYTKKVTLDNDDHDHTYNPGDNGGNPGDNGGNQGGNDDDGDKDNDRGEVTGDGDNQQGIGTGDKKDDFDDEEDEKDENGKDEEGKEEGKGEQDGVEINTGTGSKPDENNDGNRGQITTDGESQQGIGTGTKKDFDEEEEYEEETSGANFVPEGEVEVAGVTFEYGHYEYDEDFDAEIAASDAKIDSLQAQIDTLNGLKETLSGDLEAQEESIESAGLGL